MGNKTYAHKADADAVSTSQTSHTKCSSVSQSVSEHTTPSRCFLHSKRYEPPRLCVSPPPPFQCSLSRQSANQTETKQGRGRETGPNKATDFLFPSKKGRQHSPCVHERLADTFDRGGGDQRCCVVVTTADKHTHAPHRRTAKNVVLSISHTLRPATFSARKGTGGGGRTLS